MLINICKYHVRILFLVSLLFVAESISTQFINFNYSFFRMYSKVLVKVLYWVFMKVLMDMNLPNQQIYLMKSVMEIWKDF